MPSPVYLCRKLKRFVFREDGSLKEKALRSGFWLGISGVLINILSIARSVALARLLTPEIFGLMGICLILVRGVQTFSRPGFASALIYRKERVDEAKHTAFTLLVIRGVVLWLVVSLLAPFAAEFYEQPVIKNVLVVMSLSFLVGGFGNINTILLQKEMNFRRLVYLDQTVALLTTAISIGAAYYMRSVWALVIGFLATEVFRVVLSYAYVPGTPRFGFNKTLAKELFGYGKYVTGASIVLYIAAEADNAIIGKIAGIELLGYYVLAFTIANMVTTYISRTFSKIMLPAYSKLEHNPPALRAAFKKVLAVILAVTLPAALIIIVLAPELVALVYGEKWLPAVEPLRVLCVFGVIRSVTSLIGYFLNGIGRPSSVFRMSAVRLAILVVILYPLTLYYGLLGAAAGVTFAIGVQLLIGFRVVAKASGLEYIEIAQSILWPVLKSIVVLLFVFVGGGWLDVQNVVNLAALLIGTAMLYFGLNFRFFMELVRRRK